MTNYESELNRDEMLKDLEDNLGEIGDSKKQRLLSLVAELDSELLDCAANHSRHDRPHEEYVASVVYIKGNFYGDLETGSMAHSEITHDLADAAHDLGLLDEDGFDYDELISLSEWSYSWSVA